MARPDKVLTMTEPPENGIYYTAKEVINTLGIEKHTLYRHIYSGKIKAKKIRGEWRIYEKSMTDETPQTFKTFKTFKTPKAKGK